MPNPHIIPDLHYRRSTMEARFEELRARKHRLEEQVWTWRAIACACALLAIFGWYGFFMSWKVW
jgi:hypothetical protein